MIFVLCFHLFCFSDSTYGWNHTTRCLSFSDLFYLASFSQGPSMLLPMARFHFFFFLLATLASYGSSWARDGIWAAAVLYATDLAKWDPLTYCSGWGLNLSLHGDWSHSCWILNPLHHRGNASFFYYLFYLLIYTNLYIYTSSSSIHPLIDT